MNKKRLIGEIWKDDFLPSNSKYGGQWNIQFSKGIYNCHTKEDALQWQKLILKDDSIPADKKISKDTIYTKIMKNHFPELFK